MRKPQLIYGERSKIWRRRATARMVVSSQVARKWNRFAKRVMAVTDGGIPTVRSTQLMLPLTVMGGATIGRRTFGGTPLSTPQTIMFPGPIVDMEINPAAVLKQANLVVRNVGRAVEVGRRRSIQEGARIIRAHAPTVAKVVSGVSAVPPRKDRIERIQPGYIKYGTAPGGGTVQKYRKGSGASAVIRSPDSTGRGNVNPMVWAGMWAGGSRRYGIPRTKWISRGLNAARYEAATINQRMLQQALVASNKNVTLYRQMPFFWERQR